MRLFQLSATAALALSLVGPALAQEAVDCDMLCRLSGYLSTDHMATQPVEEAPARASTKLHHPRAAAHKPAPPAKPALAAASSAPASASHVAAMTPAAPPWRDTARRAPPVTPAPGAVRVAKVAEPEKAVPIAATSKVPKAPRAPIGQEAPARVVATPKSPPAAVAAVSETVAGPRAHARPPVAVAAGQKPAAQPRTAGDAKPTRTASLSTVIPGSAPAVQAGFH